MSTEVSLVLFVILVVVRVGHVSSDALHEEWDNKHKGEDVKFVQLNVEEYQQQTPFYKGKSVNDIIALCRLPNGTYDFTEENPDCVANDVTLEQGLDRIPRLKEERRIQLCNAITKVISFKARLESPAETVIQFCLFGIALIFGVCLMFLGHFRLKTMIDERFPDPTKGWAFWVYQKMSYYVVPVGKESKHTHDRKVAEKMALTAAKGRELEIGDVIDSDDEKEDVFQTTVGVTDYSDFWNLLLGQEPKKRREMYEVKSDTIEQSEQ